MCTLTVVTDDAIYRMAMNRDDKITRGVGLAPEIHGCDGIRALHPSDGNGGTWFATNEYGITLALLNWNDVPAHGIALAKLRSRGRVIPTLIASRSLSDMHEAVGVSNFEGIPPFRLVGVFPSEHEIWEWRWESTRVEFQAHVWGSRHWFSSSLSDKRAERVRGTACRNAAHESDVGSLPWLRRLHSSHTAGPGAFGVCVHRDDVKTLSYSEASVTPRYIEMNHFRGSPCAMGPIQAMEIERTSLGTHMFAMSALR